MERLAFVRERWNGKKEKRERDGMERRKKGEKDGRERRKEERNNYFYQSVYAVKKFSCKEIFTTEFFTACPL